MNKTYQVNTSKAIGEVLDGEAIIINLKTGSYYSMNTPGSTLWDAISQRKPITISSEAIEKFITMLIEEDLISEVTDRVGTPDSSEATPEAVTVNEDPAIEKYDDMQEMLLADPIHDVDNAGWPKLKTD